jgi:hypothetical protein
LPYTIRPHKGQYCVFKEGASRPIKGGCHDTKGEAQEHLAALESNVEDASFCIELFSDAAVAQRALAGEPILVVPKGTFHRRGRKFKVNDATIEDFVHNWHHREERGIRRSRVAVDRDHDRAAVGWYDNVLPLDAGLGAQFSWNEEGRQDLEAGRYAYFSPTIAWAIEDPVTGEIVENQVAGGALTNYPFFGEATALYARRVSPTDGPKIWYFVDAPAGREDTEVTMPEITISGEGADGLLNGLFSRVLGGGGTNPQGDPPNTGEPVDLDALRAELRDEFSGQIETLESRLEDERAEHAQEVENLQTRLAAVSHARESERFTRMAEGFSHLPVSTDGLAGHLMWLHSVDETEEGDHVSFFTDLLKQANERFSEAFEEQPVGGGAVQTVTGEVAALVDDYQAEHPNADYETALQAVFAQNQGLYERYSEQVRGGK